MCVDIMLERKGRGEVIQVTEVSWHWLPCGIRQEILRNITRTIHESANRPSQQQEPTTRRQIIYRQDVCHRGSDRFRSYRESKRKHSISTRWSIGAQPCQLVFPITPPPIVNTNSLRHEESQRHRQTGVRRRIG